MAVLELFKSMMVDLVFGEFNVLKTIVCMIILLIPAWVKFVIAATKLEGKEAFSYKSVVKVVVKIILFLTNFFNNLGNAILNLFR